MKRFAQFKLDVKHAILDYAHNKAGGIDKLPERRKLPCERLIRYLTTTNDDWRGVKRTIQFELTNLQSTIFNLFKRSQMRKRLQALLNEPCYSNEAFYEEEIIEKDQQIATLKSDKRNKIISELNSRILTLNKHIEELKKYNVDLKQQVKILQRENTQLQKEQEYQEEHSPTNSFCNDYDRLSIGSADSAGSYDRFRFLSASSQKSHNGYSAFDAFDDESTESPRNAHPFN